MRLIPRNRTGGFLALAGLTISSITFSWLQTMNAVPLSFPIRLAPGNFQSPEFKTHVSTQYRINIAFVGLKPSTEELDCLIGMNMKSVQPCIGQPPILNVKWQIMSRGQPIAKGSSAELVGASYSYHKVQRHIGYFDAQRGREYVVQLDVLQDATRLAEAQPTLEVEPNLNRYEGRLLLGGLAFCLGLLGAAAGVIAIFVTIFREKRFGPAPTSV